jgi:hypothetical protein
MRPLRRFVVVALALRMLLSVAAFAQDVPAQRVDQIFSIYDKPRENAKAQSGIRRVRHHVPRWQTAIPQVESPSHS